MTEHTPHADAPFVHQTCVYGSDGEFLAMATPFARDGLARGEPVLAVTTPGNIELLTGALGGDARLVEFVDAYGWYGHPATTLAAYHRYAEDHGGRPGHIRIIGEPIWTGCSEREIVEWKRYESILNVAFASSSAWIVCPYDRRVLAPEIVADALRTHPARIAGEQATGCSGFVEPEDFVLACDTEPLPHPPPTAATLPFTGDLYSVRRFVAKQAAKHGVTTESATTLVALASELATHALKYGSGRAAIRVWAGASHIVCDVHDPDGRITDPFLGYLPPTLHSEPGEGLWLARQTSDVVEIRSGDSGCTLRLHIPRPPVNGQK